MKILNCAFILFFSLNAFAGGPWLNKKKSGFFQLQSTFPTAAYNLLFLENNKESSLKRPVLDYNIQAYLEYGITDKLDIISSLPYKYVATQEINKSFSDSTSLEKGTLSGLSNYKLGFKYRVLDKKIKIAISLQSSLNTISKDLKKGLITGYEANSIGLYTHIGKIFTEKTYSFVDVGVNRVSNDYSNFFEVHYELGYQIKPSLWTAFTLDLRESFKNGTQNDARLKQTGLYTNNQEYFAFGIKASYELKNKFGLTAASFGAFSGNYVAKIATFSIGIYKKW